MPDLLASTSLLSLTPAIPARAPSIAGPAVADFMAVLGELVLPPGAKPQGGKGQALAGGGKDLPVEGELAGSEEEQDPTIAWLPALLPLQPIAPIEPQPQPAMVPAAAFVSTNELGAAAAPAGGAAPAPEAARALLGVPLAADAAPNVAAPTLIAMPVSPGPAPIEPGIAAALEGAAAPVELPPVAGEGESRVDSDVPVRERQLRPAPAQAPLVTPRPVGQGAAVAPTAGQVFAAAISASLDSPPAPAPRTSDAPLVHNQAAAAEQLRTTVQAMSGVQQPPLDLSREDWAGKMVDRIAALRDAAEAADTRIRLAPENLGTVDVSIRREGDRLHVHFVADNPATRQLLAEAAPRLAELAEARGVKLGQASVDAGAGGQQGTPGQPQSNPPARPAPAVMRTPEPDHDDRIA